MSFSKSKVVYQEGIKVLFDGTKTFWRARANIDVAIILHVPHNTVEIVAFNAVLGLKAPRLYLNFSAIKSHLDPYEFNDRLTHLKEDSLRRKKHVNLKDATIKISEDMSLDYIFQRLDVIDNCTTENFAMVLHAVDGDIKQQFDGEAGESHYMLDVVRRCPQLLIPVTVNHQKVARCVRWMHIN